MRCVRGMVLQRYYLLQDKRDPALAVGMSCVAAYHGGKTSFGIARLFPTTSASVESAGMFVARSSLDDNDGW